MVTDEKTEAKGTAGQTKMGRAWVYIIIPYHLRNKDHMTILECLSQIIAMWIDIIEKKVNKEDFILAIGDNASSMECLRRSNFSQKDKSYISWNFR